MRFFNTAGPNDPARRYTIPATRRLADENVMRLIEQQSYFVLSASHQAGKTTTMCELTKELKVWRDGGGDSLKRGFYQLDDCLASLGLDSGWLVIFDRRTGLPPIGERATTEKGVTPRLGKLSSSAEIIGHILCHFPFVIFHFPFVIARSPLQTRPGTNEK